MERNLKATIIGAGIGGLTAGIALRQAGLEVSIHERAPELVEIGALMALASNAMRALDHLGLAQQVQSCGVPLAGGAIKTAKGRTLTRAADETRTFLNVCVHRADLQRVLVAAFGEESLHLGRELKDFEQGDNSVVAPLRQWRGGRG